MVYSLILKLPTMSAQNFYLYPNLNNITFCLLSWSKKLIVVRSYLQHFNLLYHRRCFARARDAYVNHIHTHSYKLINKILKKLENISSLSQSNSTDFKLLLASQVHIKFTPSNILIESRTTIYRTPINLVSRFTRPPSLLPCTTTWFKVDPRFNLP